MNDPLSCLFIFVSSIHRVLLVLVTEYCLTGYRVLGIVYLEQLTGACNTHTYLIRILFFQIDKATNVIIIGGGAVGIEMAGEIAQKYSAKMITIIHSNSCLVN